LFWQKQFLKILTRISEGFSLFRIEKQHKKWLGFTRISVCSGYKYSSKNTGQGFVSEDFCLFWKKDSNKILARVSDNMSLSGYKDNKKNKNPRHCSRFVLFFLDRKTALKILAEVWKFGSLSFFTVITEFHAPPSKSASCNN
jgi:hypothetical protein